MRLKELRLPKVLCALKSYVSDKGFARPKELRFPKVLRAQKSYVFQISKGIARPKELRFPKGLRDLKLTRRERITHLKTKNIFNKPLNNFRKLPNRQRNCKLLSKFI